MGGSAVARSALVAPQATAYDNPRPARVSNAAEARKAAELAVREARKAERTAAKAAKQELRLASARIYRQNRELDHELLGVDSGRRRADVRGADARARRRAIGEEMGVCEHGVHRCRVCNAHRFKTKPR